ncbi:MAG: zinc ribbon domain-containing protein, partial [Anaerolineales bacterium]|nr:zinc ribbon domain-containing protein [Anaerolineales bacterium]
CRQLINAGMDQCPHCQQLLCPECLAPVSADDLSCPQCGIDFELYCPQCDAVVAADADSCPECGFVF